jgi:hypothetical protein
VRECSFCGTPSQDPNAPACEVCGAPFETVAPAASTSNQPEGLDPSATIASPMTLERQAAVAASLAPAEPPATAPEPPTYFVGELGKDADESAATAILRRPLDRPSE